MGYRYNDSGNATRRGLAIVVMVLLMMIIDLIIIGMVVTQARDHDLTVRRLQTVEALYAAEAGVNMSIRELMIPLDEDGDDDGSWPFGIGTISDDTNPATDPALGNAQFVVTAEANTPVAGRTTITSEGRSGEARRRMQAVLIDP